MIGKLVLSIILYHDGGSEVIGYLDNGTVIISEIEPQLL